MLALSSTLSGTRRVLQRGDELTVQIGVRVQAAALIARVPTISVGEPAARFLDEESPRRVIPDMAALGQECVEFAMHHADRWSRSRRRPRGTRRQTTSGLIVNGAKH